MRRVVFNQKGGVGKSTIVANLAAISAAQGTPTLVVDLDPQGNTSRYLLGDGAEDIEHSAGEFFEQTLSFRLFRDAPTSFVHATPFNHLSVIPAHPDMSELVAKLETHHKIYKLRELLEQIPGFPEVYIDTPPAFGFFTISALIAAERCLIPFDCDDFSRRALYQLLDRVEEIREDHNRELAVEGIVVNQFQARARLPIELVERLRAEGLPVLEPYISQSVKIRESHQRNRPMIHLAPSHKVTLEFVGLGATLAAKAARRRSDGARRAPSRRRDSRARTPAAAASD